MASVLPLVGVIATGLIGAVGLFQLRYDPHLVLYGAIIGAIFSGVLVFWLRRTPLANPLLAMAVMLAMIAGLDLATAALFSEPAPAVRITVDGQEHLFYLRDADLGYAPRANTVGLAEKTLGDRVIYRARYSIDPHGFRLTHGATDDRADTVVFVGCSVTFGDGIDDGDALPERFSQAKQGRDRVINAGFSGYGTHQVLKELEAGRFDGLLGGGKRVFVYTAIVEQLDRIVGLTDWDVWGPAYRLDGAAVRQVGRFHSEIGGNFVRLAQRDPLLTLIRNAWPTGLRDDPVALFGALARQAQAVAKARYGAEFVVLLWDASPPDGDPAARLNRERMVQVLTQAGVPFLRLSVLVPDLFEQSALYRIAGDGHPTGALNQRIAGELARLY